MLYEIAKELRAELEAQGVPFAVVYGPERTRSTSIDRERIVLAYVREAGSDSYAPPRSQRFDPKCRWICKTSCALRIYAQARVAGATVQDHDRRVLAVRDKAVVAMDKIANARRNAWAPTAGGLVLPDDLAASEAWPGAVYEMRFDIERAVHDYNWAGEAAPTVALGDEPGAAQMKSTTTARLAGTDHDEDPGVTACGG